jgi:hypothetical protein
VHADATADERVIEPVERACAAPPTTSNDTPPMCVSMRQTPPPSGSTRQGRPSRVGTRRGVAIPCAASLSVTARMLSWIAGEKIGLTRCSTACIGARRSPAAAPAAAGRVTR